MAQNLIQSIGTYTGKKNNNERSLMKVGSAVIFSLSSIWSVNATSRSPAFTSVPSAGVASAVRPEAHRSIQSVEETSSRRSITELAAAENSNDFFGADKPDWWFPPQQVSARRRARLVREDEVKSRFSRGKDLDNLRTDVKALRDNIKWAEAMGDQVRVDDLTAAIKKAESRDAELVYARAIKSMEKAKKIIKTKKKDEVIKKLSGEAAMAREVIPRFNLEGLWVGSYGEHGSELINVTYSGDKLIAKKITGDKHVPRGEISFEADLSPRDENNSPPLEPVKLSETAASKWGIEKLPRYPGRGQIAAEGYKEPNFVDGQLILYDGYFSFVWVPTRHHIFFSRPSPELTVHMLRDVISEEDRIENMRDHVAKCFGMDDSPKDSASSSADDDSDPFRRIPREVDLVRAMEQIEEAVREKGGALEQRFSFWQVNKWKNYLNDALKEEKD